LNIPTAIFGEDHGNLRISAAREYGFEDVADSVGFSPERTTNHIQIEDSEHLPNPMVRSLQSDRLWAPKILRNDMPP
jgi:hypothetical protein